MESMVHPVPIKETAANRPKRASIGSRNYREARIPKDCKKEDVVFIKESKVADTEDSALSYTMCATPTDNDGFPRRRLHDCCVYNDDTPSIRLDFWTSDSEYWLSGMVLPNSVPPSPNKEEGVWCESIGPITDWAIDGYEKGSVPATIRVSTEMADYILVKPSASYRKHFERIKEKAELCVHVFRALSGPDGGNPNLSYAALVSAVSQAIRSQSKPGAKAYFANEPLRLHGSFVAQQLCQLDTSAGPGDQIFGDLDAIKALSAMSNEDLEFRSKMAAMAAGKTNGTLTIRENGAENGSNVKSDEEYARMLAMAEEYGGEKKGRGNKQTQAPPKMYVKINEEEIAADYPPPTYFQKEEEEGNELDMFEGDDEVDIEFREEKNLEDWCLYNGDARLVPLELLPMIPNVDQQITIYGSGVVSSDSQHDYSMDQKAAMAVAVAGTGAAAGAEAAGQGSSSGGSHGQEAAGVQGEGLRIYLSTIREWKIEFGSDCLYVWIRTDMFWYRLGTPSLQYRPFYTPVVRVARLAIDVISMLKEETRVSRLSFTDVVSRIADRNRKNKDKVVTKAEVAAAERYLVVHGQIILQQVREYPDVSIQRSSFASGLERKLTEARHTVLRVTRKGARVRAHVSSNSNPSASLRPDATKRKPMPATTTRLVAGVWSRFYAMLDGQSMADEAEAAAAAEAAEQEEGEEEDTDDEAEEATLTAMLKSKGKSGQVKRKCQSSVVEWVGGPAGKAAEGGDLFSAAMVDGQQVRVGSAVSCSGGAVQDDSEAEQILLVEYMWQQGDGLKMMHGRVMTAGSLTVLGNAADESELFLTEDCISAAMDSIRSVVPLEKRDRPWGHAHRKSDFDADEAHREAVRKAREAGLPAPHFFRKLYAPSKGAFLDLPEGGLAVGDGQCRACRASEASRELQQDVVLPRGAGFRHRGVSYRVNGFAYVEMQAGEEQQQSGKERPKGSGNVGLKPWLVVQIVKVETRTEGKGKGKGKVEVPHRVVARRFYRPADVSKDMEYRRDVREVYYSDVQATFDLKLLRGTCQVFRSLGVGLPDDDDVFFCYKAFDPVKGTLTGEMPWSIKFSMDEEKSREGKERYVEGQEEEEGNQLATLDIFAGCGGLSEGLQQSGVSKTKWAIEYEHPAAQAFALNHPDAQVFCDNCNVILRCIMEKGGDESDCLSCEEANKQAMAVSEEKKNSLPLPGQVDFINGGPPCQGFSGMNRFNTGAWSKIQCEMILAHLSFADYLRPRYFLLENVRNFVSFNKGQTFRLTLASLLAMGYQVRFGVLQAGNFGVAQSRKRAFIWAAAPGEAMPDWPKPRHVFASSQVNIPMPNGGQYCATPGDGRGAPLRSITVRDTIGDLPPVQNGENREIRDYEEESISWFQKRIRGEQTVLRDHVCKEMNELNLERCRRVPKEQPGADWRMIPAEMMKLCDGRQVELIPWCLPNTASRHNQWKGLFGRLDWDGNFPTSVTDPQPMGKVGMCFHPNQDRIVTVRECARSQGFPDHFQFSGTMQAKHRQIGNAVPPPLAHALGRMLKKAIQNKETVASGKK